MSPRMETATNAKRQCPVHRRACAKCSDCETLSYCGDCAKCYNPECDGAH